MGLLLFLIVFTDELIKYSLLVHRPTWLSINHGVAFGFGQSWLLVIGVMLMVLIGYWSHWKPRYIWLGLVLAVLANLSDRFLVGGVMDYLRFGPLRFNLSDLVILGCIGWLLQTKKDTR